MAENDEQEGSSEAEDVNEEAESTETEEEGTGTEDTETEEEVVEEEEEEEESEEEKASPKESRAQARIRELVSERKTLLAMLERTAPANKQQEDDGPELDPEVDKAVNAKLKKQEQAHNAKLGQIMEKLDESKAMSTIPEYSKSAKLRDQIEDFRQEKAEQGVYFTREDAYDLLVSKGRIKVPKPTKKVTVVKSKPNVAIERATKKAPQSKEQKGKSFKDMTLDEKEKYLSDKTF